MQIRIANFNVENLFSRYSLLNTDDPELREKLEADRYATFSLTNKTRKGQNWQQIKRDTINEIAQQNTAQIIDLINADIICLQEVEDLPALRNFTNKILEPIQQKNGNKPYSYFLLIDGNDPRGIDVAIMSKYQFGNISTHMYEEDETGWPLFSRDCLEVDVLLNNSKIHFLIQHFKSQISRPADTNGIKKRTRQATRVAEILEDLVNNDPAGNYVVAGDFNDVPNSQSLNPLLKNNLGFYNTIEELSDSQRWTYIHGTKKQQFDYLLVSRNLKSKISHFDIERRGISRSRTAYDGDRLDSVQKDGTEASDHCGIYLDLNF